MSTGIIALRGGEDVNSITESRIAGETDGEVIAAYREAIELAQITLSD